MLTLSSEFIEEAERSEAEFIYVVEIWTGTSTPLIATTGSKRMTFTSIYNPFTGDTDAGQIAYPGVHKVTSIATEMDPFQRNVQHSNVTVTFHDDGLIRDFLQTTRIRGKSINIKLGTYNIPAEADWAPVFRGIIESVSYRQGQLDVNCFDHFKITNRPFLGNWLNQHPLEVIEDILGNLGYPEELIDSDSFDPTDSDYSDIAHYVVGYFNAGLGPGANGNALPGGHPNIADTQFLNNPVEEPIEGIINSFAKGMVGSVVCQENGVIKFVKFNPDATVVANWTENDIDELEQNETILVNQIDCSVTGQDIYVLDGQTAKSASFRINDSASQTNFAYPGEDKGVYSESVAFEMLDYMANYGTHGTTGFSGTGGVTITVLHPWGLSGCRVSGNYTHPGPWSGLQTAGTTAAADRPVYFMLDEEVVKCISIALPNTGSYHVPIFSGNSMTPTTAKEVPIHAELTITSGNRGFFGTTAAAHNSSTESDGKVLDITMAVDFATTQLARFSNGAATISVTTSLAQWAVQIGDLVTVTHDKYCEYKFDGLSTNTRWEITNKELHLGSGGASIKWTLCYADQASLAFPAVSAGYDWIKKEWVVKDPLEGYRYASEAEIGVSRHVCRGFDCTTSGLNATIKVGSAAMGGTVLRNRHNIVIALIASKDHYITFGFPSGGFGVHTVSTGAAEPDIGPTELLLYKLVAGGSTITTVDLREYAAIKPRSLSPTHFEQGANLIPNPDFETWSRGKICPPDNWFMQTLDWIDDANREETTTYSGNYAVNLGGQYATLMSDPFRVERNRVYQFGGATKPSASSGITLTVGIRWLDADKATISDEAMFTHTGNTTLTRNDVFTVAPDTAVYASAYCINSHAVDGLYDAFRMVRAMPSFHATVNGAQSIADGATDTIEFDTEKHDHGSQYDHSSDYDFTAKFAGLYQFNAQVRIIAGATVTSFAPEIRLVKNGSTVVCVGIAANDGNSSGLWQFLLNPGPIKLAVDDTIEVQINNNAGRVFPIEATDEDSWFMGMQIQ